MKKIIVGNWKLNPESASAAEMLAQSVDRRDVVICPPFIYLVTVREALKRAKLGAQDAFWLNKGAYTGEVSPSQLKDLGVEYVILGHSERRQFLLESDEIINRKVRATLTLKLNVILCVGEPLTIHEGGAKATLGHIAAQLEKALVDVADKGNLVVAYEPIWAIGTGETETPANTNSIAENIKKLLGEKVPVLYGGSITKTNAADFLAQPAIDGLLVGGASLKPEEFNEIGA
jgi:triosephosphate isomerase